MMIRKMMSSVLICLLFYTNVVFGNENAGVVKSFDDLPANSIKKYLEKSSVFDGLISADELDEIVLNIEKSEGKKIVFDRDDLKLLVESKMILPGDTFLLVTGIVKNEPGLLSKILTITGISLSTAVAIPCIVSFINFILSQEGETSGVLLYVISLFTVIPCLTIGVYNGVVAIGAQYIYYSQYDPYSITYKYMIYE